MTITLGVILGIASMLCWGIADFFAAQSVKRTSSFNTFFWSQSITLVVYMVSLFFFPVNVTLTPAHILMIIGAAAIGVFSFMAYYHGLQVSKVSLVTALGASWVLIAVLFGIVFLGEHFSMLQGIGFLCTIVGVVLASLKLKELFNEKKIVLVKGIEFGANALVLWGFYFVLLTLLIKDLGWLAPAILVKTLTTMMLMVYVLVSRKNVSIRQGDIPAISAVAFLEGIGYITFGNALLIAPAIIVTPLAATHPIVTILLAFVIFRERLGFAQTLGVGAALLGIVLLSL